MGPSPLTGAAAFAPIDTEAQGSRVTPPVARRDVPALLLYDGAMLDQMSACHSDYERLERMFEQAPGFMALLEGPQHKIAIANQAFLELVGRGNLVGKTLEDALPEFTKQGF